MSYAAAFGAAYSKSTTMIYERKRKHEEKEKEFING